MAYAELKELIISKYGSEASMARKIGWSRQRLNKITTGTKEPDVEELAVIARAVGKSISSVAEIFLRQKSPNG